MSKIARYFLEKASEPFREDKQFMDYYQANYTTPLEETMERLYEEQFAGKDIGEALRVLKRNKTKQKKRWVSSAVSNFENPPSGKPKEILFEYNSMISLHQTYPSGVFLTSFGAETPKEAIMIVIELMTKWSQKDDPMYRYRFFPNRTPKQRQNAMQIDLLVAMGVHIMNYYDGNPRNVVEEMPNSTVANSVATIGVKKRMELSTNEVVLENNVYLENKYEVKGYIFQTLVDSSYAEKGVRVLDGIDMDIFRHILRHRDEKFLMQRKIFFNLTDIVKNVFNSDGAKSYEALENRIIKLSNMKFNVVHEEENIRYGYGLIDNYVIKKVNGIRIAEITVNEVLHQEITEEQVVRIYSDKLKLFVHESSRVFIFPLQKDRLLFHSNGTIDKVHRYDYHYFLMKTQFPSRSKADNMQMIVKSLEEFREQKVVIESFERINDSFNIHFLPVSKYEEEDLISSATLAIE